MLRLSRFLPQSLAVTAAWMGGQSAAAQAPVERLPAVASVVPAEVAAVTPAPVVEGTCATCGGCGCAACTAAFDFKKVPPVRPQTRAGMFSIPPGGPGAYSLLAAVQGNKTDGPPKFGYPAFALMPLPFSDVDFRYLDDPKTPPDALDRLKRMHVGDDWLVSVGGQSWSRYHNEYNSRLGQRDNTYFLTRSRFYADVWYRDSLRLFAELNVSYTALQDLPPLPIDESGPDIQNLFADIKLGELRNAPVYLRVGRQELQLGSQRLVSALDWANTRRTFQGLRLFRTGEKFDADLFVLQPVVPNANRLDSGDNNQVFAGAFTTYRPMKGRAVDLYYLMLDNTNTTIQQSIVRAPHTTHTVGSRYYGDQDLNDCYKLLWDFEGGLQFGQRGRQDIFAGFASAGTGVNFRRAAWNPTLWLTYDYASGDDSPNGGRVYGTFNQLFPFGHYYLGWADLVGRQNIHDVNVSLYLNPAKWVTTNLQVHNFWLDNVRAGLYNTAGVVTRRSTTGTISPYVGTEVDIINNFHLTKRTDFLVSYAYLFGGGFLRQTTGPITSTNASVAAAMFSVRY